MTQLRELDSDSLPTVAQWLACEENYRWLDFGGDVQLVSPIMLRLMVQRPIHCLRVFSSDESDRPIGIVGLSNITPIFKTASLWYVLGDKGFGGRGYTARAVGQLLDHGFGCLELESVHAWAVEENVASVRVLEKSGFRLIGRQRRCHWLGDRHVDRLLFDLLAHEHGSVPCTTNTC